MNGPNDRRGTDLRLYKDHLRNVNEAKSKTDNAAPRLPPKVYVKEADFLGDIFRLRVVELENRQLLKAVNTIYRTKGKADCQLRKYVRAGTKYEKNCEALEKDRKFIADFLERIDLKNLKSRYDHKDLEKDWQRMLKVMKYTARYPEFYDKKAISSSWSICPPEVISDPNTHHVCWMNLRIGDRPRCSRLLIELYSDVVPGTAANFAALCDGRCGGGLAYRDSIFHRIVPDLFCIGGDVTGSHSGASGMSVYGPAFPDENFTLRHNGPGVVAMYATKPDGNNSQFLITFRRLDTLNGKYVVIGRVISDPKILRLIESCGTKGGKPLAEVRILDCGVRLRSKSKTSFRTELKECLEKFYNV